MQHKQGGIASLFILSNLDTHIQFVSFYYVKSLYMFRAGSPIIRRFVRVLYTKLTGLPCVTEGCRVSTGSHYVSHCVSLRIYIRKHNGSHNDYLY